MIIKYQIITRKSVLFALLITSFLLEPVPLFATPKDKKRCHLHLVSSQNLNELTKTRHKKLKEEALKAKKQAFSKKMVETFTDQFQIPYVDFSTIDPSHIEKSLQSPNEGFQYVFKISPLKPSTSDLTTRYSIVPRWPESLKDELNILILPQKITIQDIKRVYQGARNDFIQSVLKELKESKKIRLEVLLEMSQEIQATLYPRFQPLALTYFFIKTTEFASRNFSWNLPPQLLFQKDFLKKSSRHQMISLLRTWALTSPTPRAQTLSLQLTEYLATLPENPSPEDLYEASLFMYGLLRTFAPRKADQHFLHHVEFLERQIHKP